MRISTITYCVIKALEVYVLRIYRFRYQSQSLHSQLLILMFRIEPNDLKKCVTTFESHSTGNWLFGLLYRGIPLDAFITFIVVHFYGRVDDQTKVKLNKNHM